LKAGAAVNAATEQGITALHNATEPGDIEHHSVAQHCYDEVVAQLLKGGANASTTTLNGAVLLHIAAFHGKCTIMQQLLAAGARCAAVNSIGEVQRK
jgi:ankyrin repeat protein